MLYLFQGHKNVQWMCALHTVSLPEHNQLSVQLLVVHGADRYHLQGRIQKYFGCKVVQSLSCCTWIWREILSNVSPLLLHTCLKCC